MQEVTGNEGANVTTVTTVPDRPVRLVLASQSPRRRELLKRAGASFCCLVPGVDEHVPSSVPVREMAQEVASRKAHAALQLLGGDDSTPIVACDTTVIVDDAMFGKPADAAEARAMLQALSGRTHHVVSGVSILHDGAEIRFIEDTGVTFHQLSSQQIDDYIATGEPFDKAGAYGIQGAAGVFVSRVDGDYDNVVGLPLTRVMEVLSSMDDKQVQSQDQDQTQAQAQALADEKARVRAQMKAVRKNMTPQQRELASQQVCQQLMAMPEFQQARVVGVYCAFGSELCFDYLARNWPADKVLAVPCTIGNFRMEFIAVEPSQILPGQSTVSFLANPGKLSDIPEGMQPLDESEVDLVLVPGLAFDDQGFRIGYGGGYYDNYLARPRLRAAVLGTFFEEQHYAGSLPRGPYDRPLPAVVTQQQVYRF